MTMPLSTRRQTRGNVTLVGAAPVQFGGTCGSLPPFLRAGCYAQNACTDSQYPTECVERIAQAIAAAAQSNTTPSYCNGRVTNQNTAVCAAIAACTAADIPNRAQCLNDYANNIRANALPQTTEQETTQTEPIPSYPQTKNKDNSLVFAVIGIGVVSMFLFYLLYISFKKD